MRKYILKWIFPAIFAGILLNCKTTEKEASKNSYNRTSTEFVENLISQMTLKEKVRFIGGNNYMETQAIERLGIPAIRFANGRSGVRPWKTPNYPYAVADTYRRGTCFPAGIGMGSSWDTDLLYAVGEAIGKECNDKDIHILAGPGVNMARNPFNGRNFESYGEDPFLTGKMAVSFIRGVQSQGVMANVVMFAAMHQEVNRLAEPYQNLIIPERVLRELYLPAFETSVMEGEVASFMSAYVRINNEFCSENDWLLNKVLKKEWGFKGFVLSDWGAVHSALPTALGGMDLEMPSAKYMNFENLEPHLKSGELPESLLDDKLRRILLQMVRFGIFDKQVKKEKACETPEHRKLAQKIAEAGMVLLKNANGLLPLNKDEIKKVAVIGPGAVIPRLGGGGSSTVAPTHMVSPIDGLKQEFTNAEIIYAKGFNMKGDIFPISSDFFTSPEGECGLKGEYFPNRDLKGEPAMVRIDPRIAFDWGEEDISDNIRYGNYSIRWTGALKADKDDIYLIETLSSGTLTIWLNGEPLVGNAKNQITSKPVKENSLTVNELAINKSGTKAVRLEKGKSYKLVATFVPKEQGKAAAVLGWEPHKPDLVGEAVKLAGKSDVAVIFAGISNQFETEGRDLETIRIPEQTELIRKIAAVNPKTIVVLNNGTPLLIKDLLDASPAVIEAWYPGQEGGLAVARIISGAVNPSGRLPVSFALSEDDIPALATYPPEKGQSDIEYSEGVFIGYRYHETKGAEALLPFGYGLSYTTFDYENISISDDKMQPNGKLTVAVTVKNTGAKPGAEVVQLYLHDSEASVERPVRELKGFKKVFLEPGEKKTVEMIIQEKDLQFWDETNSVWKAEPGTFEVQVGKSAADIQLSRTFEFKSN